MSESFDSISEEYLQISPNILTSFPRFRPPVSLYIFDEKTNTVKLYAKQEERVSKQRQEELGTYCDEGLLYLSRGDYKIYAKHISKKLGLILVETSLNEQEIAEIFYQALTSRLHEFFDQPTEPVYQAMEKDITILSEYLWIDPCRVLFPARNLHTDYDQASHSVNTMFVGLAIYIFFNHDKMDKLYLNKAALGFLLHDLGMSKVPAYITDKNTVLRKQEQESVRLHPQTGLNILSRLQITDEEIVQCIMQHHERLDGGGYPNRLKGAEISPMGRMCAVADSYCAMLSERPFRPALPPAKAALTLVKDVLRYDERIAKALVQVMIKGMPFGCQDQRGKVTAPRDAATGD